MSKNCPDCGIYCTCDGSEVTGPEAGAAFGWLILMAVGIIAFGILTAHGLIVLIGVLLS